MSAKISAIVPTYNRAALLPETIQSIVAQTRPVDEIIIWDDGSTDNTSEVVSELEKSIVTTDGTKDLPKLHYFRSENGGKSRALNLALQKATGAYIWICDDDDIGLPHATAMLAEFLDQDQTLCAVGGCYKRFSQETDTSERVFQGPGYWPDLSSGSTVRHLLEDIFLFQHATLVRKSAFDAVGPFREDLARSIDYDMVARLACNGPIKIVNDPVFLQRKHDGDRGPAAARHAAAKSDEAWKAADIDVFAPFAQSIPLSLYAALFESDDPILVQRAALLQRACVYARRTDWDVAVANFSEAATLAPDLPITSVEAGICSRALAGKHGCAEAFKPEIRNELSKMTQHSVTGAGIGKALARGAVWRCRLAFQEKRFSEAAAIATFMVALMRPASLFKSYSDTRTLAERSSLPLDAFCKI